MFLAERGKYIKTLIKILNKLDDFEKLRSILKKLNKAACGKQEHLHMGTFNKLSHVSRNFLSSVWSKN